MHLNGRHEFHIKSAILILSFIIRLMWRLHIELLKHMKLTVGEVRHISLLGERRTQKILELKNGLFGNRAVRTVSRQ